MEILLWEKRTAKGYSLRSLAERSGISKTEINDIENGNRSPTLDTLERLAVALECSICDLFRE